MLIRGRIRGVLGPFLLGSGWKGRLGQGRLAGALTGAIGLQISDRALPRGGSGIGHARRYRLSALRPYSPRS